MGRHPRPVRDLGSTNGTQLNGAPVKEAVLEPDSVITIGRTRIVFRVLAQASAPAGGRCGRPGHRAPRHGRVLGARPMSELTLLVLQLGFLLLLWVFVFAIVYALRTDLFGQRVRKLQPDAAAAAARAGGRVPASPARAGGSAAPTAAVSHPAAPASGPGGETASTENATRLVITTGPKAGAEFPLGRDELTIGRSSESAPRHPRRLHLHPPRAPHAVERPVDDPGPRLHQRHLPRRLASDRARRRSRSDTTVKIGSDEFELRR